VHASDVDGFFGHGVVEVEPRKRDPPTSPSSARQDRFQIKAGVAAEQSGPILLARRGNGGLSRSDRPLLIVQPLP
jgi:hypothetical protein